MKIMFLLTVLLIITTNVYAESPTDKGVYSLGGSISYTKVEDDDGSDTEMFLISPSSRYFLYDNIAVGVSLTYEKTSRSIFDTKTYGIGPTLRYYLPNKSINPFIEAGYSYSKTKSSSIETRSNEYSFGFGLDYFLSRNVSIEPIVKYSWRDYEADSYIPAYYVSTIDLDWDEKILYIGIGVNLFIF